MDVHNKLSEQRAFCLSLFHARSVHWKFRGYLTDPRICVVFEDDGVLTSGPLPANLGPEVLAEEYRYRIHEEKASDEERFVSVRDDVFSVEWEYEKFVSDRRIVIHFKDGSKYKSGPFSNNTDVPAFAQTLSKQGWIFSIKEKNGRRQKTEKQNFFANTGEFLMEDKIFTNNPSAVSWRDFFMGMAMLNCLHFLSINFLTLYPFPSSEGKDGMGCDNTQSSKRQQLYIL